MISVIVPVYGVEKYLPKCIESLVKQTFKDIEIVLIDDGSPDSCGKYVMSMLKIMNNLLLFIK